MYLYGASGHAKVIIDILLSNDKEVKGLFDDNKKIESLLGYPVFSPEDIKSPLIISIGDNKTRKLIAEKYAVSYGIAIAKTAIISHFSTIGEGSVIMQGTVIQASVKIGKHTIVNTSSSIDHECTIGDFVHISPNSTLCGNVSIGEGSWIGAGSTILPGVKIGKWSVIGAGSVVSKNIPDHVLAVGNRCNIIKKL
ncbi:MAG: acetyltransferase [Tannerellaceae bacterium]|nr:acetyltransferase [Tannerellaceae bacterium]